jgi:hypothetical protein
MHLDIVRFYSRFSNQPVTEVVDGKEVTTIKAVKKDFVEYAQPGYRGSATAVASIGEIRSIEDCDPMGEDNEDRLARMELRDAILTAYERFKAGSEQTKAGFPLSAWTALDAEQVAAFRMCGISVVEEIATLTDQVKPRVAHIGDLNSLMKQAKIFLASADQQAAANRMKSLEDEKEALKEQVAEQARMLEQLKAWMVEKDQEQADASPKPRRAKAEVAA